MTTHKNVCSCDFAGGGLCGKIGGRENFGSAKTVKSAELTTGKHSSRKRVYQILAAVNHK